MVLVESHQNPIVLDEAASVLLMKNKIKDLKDEITIILKGKMKIKNPEDQAELEAWIDENEDSIRKVDEALNYDAEDMYKKGTAIYSYLTSMGILLVSAILSPINSLATLIGLIIGLIHSILVLIKTHSTTANISDAINAVKKLKKELLKVNKNKITNKALRKRYDSLLEDIDDTLDSVGAND